jgi:hypothetical protein
MSGQTNVGNRRAEYEAYLASPEWKARREALLEAHGNRCSHCGIPRGLARQIDGQDLNEHHLTYANLGEEQPEDCEARCWPCHAHEEFRKDRRKEHLAHIDCRMFRDEIEWGVIGWLYVLQKYWELKPVMLISVEYPFYLEIARAQKLTLGEMDYCFSSCVRNSPRRFGTGEFGARALEVAQSR